MAPLTKAEQSWRRELLARGLKWCPRCEHILAVSEFAQSGETNDGYQSYCRECHVEIYQANREQRLRWQAQYGCQHVQDVKRRNATYYQGNGDRLREWQCKYYANHLSERQEYSHTYIQSTGGRLARQTATHRRKARVRSLPAELTTRQWIGALDYFGNRCAYCGAESEVLHQEHFIPCAAGGGLTAANIIPACSGCNLSKKDTMPAEWAAGRGAARIMPNALDNISKYFAEMAPCG